MRVRYRTVNANAITRFHFNLTARHHSAMTLHQHAP
jgi:hypothetical protein